MTDNEIVKALECCWADDCKNCPFGGKEDCVTMYDALDLINRQKAEIEELKSKNSNLTSDLTSLQNDLTSAKAEIEMDDVEIKELQIALQGYLDDVTRVRNLYKKSIEELNQAKAEIERLRNHIQEGIDLAKQIPEMMELVKAEAYREFAERLKICLQGDVRYDNKILFECDINNLLKELVGDNNVR